MKKTNYYKSTIIVGIIGLVMAFIFFIYNMSLFSAVAFVAGLISLYAGQMSPAWKKYEGYCTVEKRGYRMITMNVTSCCKVGPVRKTDYQCPKCGNEIL